MAPSTDTTLSRHGSEGLLGAGAAEGNTGRFETPAADWRIVTTGATMSIRSTARVPRTTDHGRSTTAAPTVRNG